MVDMVAALIYGNAYSYPSKSCPDPVLGPGLGTGFPRAPRPSGRPDTVKVE